MNNQDAKKIGNQHSSLLDQLIKAAEGVKPKEVTLFKDTIIKIASDTPPTLKETLDKVVQDAKKHTKIMKQAQFNAPPVSAEPNFDEMASGSPEIEEPGLGEAGLGEAGEGNGEDMEGAKQHLVDALVSLCGGTEQAIESIQSSGSEFDSMDDGGDIDMTEELGEEEELDDDMIPSELLRGNEPNNVKPMMQDPLM